MEIRDSYKSQYRETKSLTRYEKIRNKHMTKPVEEAKGQNTKTL